MNNIKGMSEKTRALFEQFISEVQKESFAEGYETGKSSVKNVEEKTPNQQRAELIAKAKKFVEEKTKNLITCDFIVKSEERLIQLYSRLPYKEFNLTTVRCHPTDVFNEWIGKAIALSRVLKLPVPVEFLKAVQPSEVVVGMKVEVKGVYHPYVSTILREGAAINGDENTIDFIERNPDRVIQIVNDTNAKYEVST